jgi:hypothetical protein
MKHIPHVEYNTTLPYNAISLISIFIIVHESIKIQLFAVYLTSLSCILNIEEFKLHNPYMSSKQVYRTKTQAVRPKICEDFAALFINH